MNLLAVGIILAIISLILTVYVILSFHYHQTYKYTGRKIPLYIDIGYYLFLILVGIIIFSTIISCPLIFLNIYAEKTK
jgi:hypothetical protein